MMKRKHSKRRILVAVMTVFVLLILSLMPTDYYIEAPGSANRISDFVTTKAAKPSKNLYMMTVSERPAILADLLWSYTQPFETRLSKTDLMANQDSDTYEQLQQYYMQTSQDNAIYYAAKRAGKNPKRQYLGVYVMSVLAGSSFKNKLKLGDTVTGVNGITFKSTKDLIQYTRQQKLKQTVTIQVVRQGKKRQFTGKIVKVGSTGKNGIGMTLVDHIKTKTSPQIKINAGDIGGPSAGLMFALECYQIYTHQDLTHGRKIAGTGTIDEDGHVGIIGGVDKKVVAAANQGMKVFFAPTDQPDGVKRNEVNYVVAKQTAKKIHTSMKIIPVANFSDALHYLQTH